MESGPCRDSRPWPTPVVTVGAVAAAVVLAIVGGLIAGSLGGWRAARLRPADAMSQVA